MKNRLEKHLEKSHKFFNWLNNCPFIICKIVYGGHGSEKKGQTTVTFIWDKSYE